METQLERKVLIEKLEKKVEGLDFFIEEANLKINKVNKKIDFLEKLDRKMESLKSLSDQVDDKILNIAKEKSGLDDQEKRMNTLTSEMNAL